MYIIILSCLPKFIKCRDSNKTFKQGQSMNGSMDIMEGIVSGRVYARCSIDLMCTLVSIKCRAFEFALSSISAGVEETIREEEEAGWQPISAMSCMYAYKCEM